MPAVASPADDSTEGRQAKPAMQRKTTAVIVVTGRLVFMQFSVVRQPAQRRRVRGSCGDRIDPEHEEALGCGTHGFNLRATLAVTTQTPKRIRVHTSAETPTIVTTYPVQIGRASCRERV